MMTARVSSPGTSPAPSRDSPPHGRDEREVREMGGEVYMDAEKVKRANEAWK